VEFDAAAPQRTFIFVYEDAAAGPIKTMLVPFGT
jgi:hypothetical protein